MAVRLNKQEREAKKWFLELEGHHSHEYKSRCEKCGKPYILLTQEDDYSEYKTPVAVKCDCGGRAYFSLPVN